MTINYRTTEEDETSETIRILCQSSNLSMTFSCCLFAADVVLVLVVVVVVVIVVVFPDFFFFR